MKKFKYLVAGLLISLSMPAVAQEVSYQQALKPISEALSANPNDPKAGKDLINTYKKTYKKDAEALVGLGTTFLQQHRFDDAQAMADMVLANKKFNQSSAYVLRGDIAALKDSVGNAGAAAAEYQTAISIDPQNVSAYERYARVYRHVNSKVAVEKLQELRKVKPDYPVEVTAAEIYLGDRKYSDALEWFDKADKSQLDESRYYNYAVAAYYSGKPAKAMQVVDEGLQKFAKSEYLSRFGALAAVDLKKYPEALTYSQNVMAGKSQKNFNDYYYYGQALAGNQKYTEAIDAYNKCLDMKPDFKEPINKISEAYKGLGEEDKALEYSRKYLDENKDASSSDWANLAQIYVAKADKADASLQKDLYNQAMAVYEQMTTKFTYLKDWCWMNEAQIALGKLKDLDKFAELNKNIAAFEEAKATKDEQSVNYLKNAYYSLGYYYTTKQDVETAKSYFQKLLQIDPNNEEAKKFLAE